MRLQRKRRGDVVNVVLIFGAGLAVKEEVLRDGRRLHAWRVQP
jgi:hypothetical protein